MTKGHSSDDPQQARAESTTGVYRAFTMRRLTELRRDMKSAHARVASLRETVSTRRAIKADQDVAWTALQEVDVAHEELRVAEEELHAQAEEIAVTRGALDAERRRYTDLFERAPDAYVVTNELGCVIEANRRAGLMFNLDPLFFAGKPLASYVHAEDRARFRDLVALMGTARAEAQLRIVPRQGEERWVSLAAQGTYYGTKESSVIRWLIRDVHEETLASRQRAQLEEELRSSIRELEASKLLFDQLCKAVQVSEQPSQPVPASDESLLGEVAHEMRTPLGSIAGWLHILSQEQHGDIARRALASMTRSVRVLAKLTEDLLDHTRFTEQGIKLDRTPINLLRLLIHTVEDARPLAELKRLQLKFSAHPHRIELHVDPVRLQQLFRNLIGNALKFTPSGGSVRVSVAVAQHAAVVTIADTGKGIAAGALETIFEPFAQVERARGQEAGVGLGLSIARRIAELHGGTVTAESDGLGRGATFRVTLPFTTFN